MSNKDEIIWQNLMKYCDNITRYVDGMNKDDFNDDDKTILACAFCLGQIGELTKKLSDEMKSAHPKIPWQKMYGLRNRIFHDYEGIDLSLLWEIVKDDIPKLRIDLIASN